MLRAAGLLLCGPGLASSSGDWGIDTSCMGTCLGLVMTVQDAVAQVAGQTPQRAEASPPDLSQEATAGAITSLTAGLSDCPSKRTVAKRNYLARK
ncbi:unnamed protein product [Clonostachys rosea]|uniref:Uncharacterized protein n=1 Tax=Bionectria ochroleuca TaxID=29856 RepID=A0ABY6U049_BIOOC|nr:unnamed protein product [Clonostachys rosea]